MSLRSVDSPAPAKINRRASGTTWFLEPYDAPTNLVIATNNLTTADEIEEITMPDGTRRQAWRVEDWDKVNKALRSRESLHLRFKVYCQFGRGPIRPAPDFLLNPKKKKSRRK